LPQLWLPENIGATFAGGLRASKMRGPMVLALKPRELSDYRIPGAPQETQADPATLWVAQFISKLVNWPEKPRPE
jgi:hypothetical protein